MSISSCIFRIKERNGKKSIFLFSFIPLIKIKPNKTLLFFIIPIKAEINWLLNFCAFIFQRLPIKKNRVLIWSMQGQGYGDNPKYIAKEMIKQGGFEIVWLYDRNKLRYREEFPQEIKLVEFCSIKALYYLATYNIFISNVRQTVLRKNGLKKKDGQIYIQTWHGHFVFKRIEAEAKNLPASYVEIAIQDSKDIDYLSSGAKWSEERLFKETFWYSGEYFRHGNPRNDILFAAQEEIKEKIHNYFDIPKDTKILLYAPTFRDSCKQSAYNLDYLKLKQILEKEFHGNWIILSRLHPNLIMEKNILPNYEWVKDATKYPDMQELLSVTNILISDYSSSMFDFLITGRPAFVYATDVDDYEKERGVAISFEDSPFMIARDNSQLMKNIEFFDVKKYQTAVSQFLEDYGSYDKGVASKKMVEFILSITGGEK